ncbi:MAG: DUF1552 domain-containing protein [Bdellovibrionales bacterium]
MIKKTLNRRTVLRGMGVTIGLPLLDCMLPGFSEKAMAQAVGGPRLVILYKPNGYYPGSWTVNNINALPSVLQPLNAMRSEITVVQGMNNSASASYDDGHAPRLSCFLTGGPITPSTSTITAPKSIDQIIADSRGSDALTLSGPFSHGTDNGFNGEYFSSLSWVGPRADTRIMSPRALFDQIFATAGGGGTPSSEIINQVYKKSILDYVKDEANRKMASLGTTDKAKLDEYLTGVREIEVKLGTVTSTPMTCNEDIARPAASNGFETHTRLMMDLLIKALQCGRNDVVTYIMDPEVGNGYRNHHSVSHFNDNSTYPQILQEIDRWYVEQYAYLIGKMNTIQEAGGTMLANSCVILGSGSGGNPGEDHTTKNVPLVMAGSAKGLFPNRGRVLNKSNVRLANFMLTLLNKYGVARSSFGDSNGTLADL